MLSPTVTAADNTISADNPEGKFTLQQQRQVKSKNNKTLCE